jgi:hypothetical protein
VVKSRRRIDCSYLQDELVEFGKFPVEVQEKYRSIAVEEFRDHTSRFVR